VVSGKCKGAALKAVPGLSTRPTTDKVKEAIFNIIGPYFDGGVCLDLFAGSGGLGIEALSRGAEKSIFVDRDGKAIQTIKENIRSCSLEEQTEVYRNDANRAIKAIIKRGIKLDYIFLDPPYKKQQLEALMKIIDEQSILNVNGIVVCEHSSDIVIPNQIGNLSRVKEETYGITTISIYKNNPLT
jgi:16S rRNA (guanine(966)-N(2))-methyltransferase RsmD